MAGDSYVSELLYIHSKVMIVDDKRVIVGVDFMSIVWLGPTN